MDGGAGTSRARSCRLSGRRGSGSPAAAAPPRWRGRTSRQRFAAPRGPGPAASGRARRDRSTGGAVVPRLADERLEQPQVLPGLRMPEHAEREAVRGILERLDRAVGGARRLAQTLAEPTEALMVMRLHRRVLAQQPAELRLRIDRNAVLGELARELLVLLVADDVRQVLDEVAAEGDVEHLRAPADREHGHVSRQRGLQQRQLRAVALLNDAAGRLVGLLAVGRRVEIGAA